MVPPVDSPRFKSTDSERTRDLVGFYALNGVRYLGPFKTRAAARQAALAKWPDLSHKRQGTVELLDGAKSGPLTFGRLGPLKPRYT